MPSDWKDEVDNVASQTDGTTSKDGLQFTQLFDHGEVRNTCNDWRCRLPVFDLGELLRSTELPCCD